ncbi:MAG: hypothetical protein RIF41_40680, partial [Polyangiaceae bacterium]
MSDKGKRQRKGGASGVQKRNAARIRKKIGKIADGFAEGIAPPKGGAHHHDMSSARTFEHNGRKCVIKTHYEITVDGEELGGHLAVDQRGR